LTKMQDGVAHFEYDMVWKHTMELNLMKDAAWTPIDPQDAAKLRDAVCEHYGVRKVALQFYGVSAGFRKTKKGWGITLPRYTLNHTDRMVTPLRLLNVEAVLHELAHYLMWDRRGDGKLREQGESAHELGFVKTLDELLLNWDWDWRHLSAEIQSAAQVRPVDEEKKAKFVAEMKERRANR